MYLNILSFNWHEPYLCNLAKLGHKFHIVAPQTGPGVFRKWDTKMRTLPKNVTELTPEEAQKRLHDGEFDLAIANNVKDLIWLKDYDLPKINVFHCRLSTEIALSNSKIDKADYLEKLEPLLRNVSNVFISQSKKEDWGLEGEVIIHGIDLEEYGGYTGENPVALRVGNLIKEMDLARGYTQSEEILKGHPSVTLGMNPLIPGARISQGFKDLLEHYQKSRVYISTTMEAYEDGYNLSLLEAMATGMPVVSYKNNTSPIVDGVNGYISENLHELNDRVGELISDHSKAISLGQNARQTIAKEFPIDAFLLKWSEVIKQTLARFLADRGVDPARQETPIHLRTRKNILMDYVSHPATTAYYLERAFREAHNVVTTGASINQEVIEKWDLKALNWPVKDQDIFRGSDGSLVEVLKQLPSGWQPDFYMYVETGLSGVPEDLEKIQLPKVCYLIDTHLHLEHHIELANKFDHVFIAQKEYLTAFVDAGIENVHWLPLGCDPEIHGRQEVQKEYDVGFVGSINSSHPRRQQLLEAIEKNFDLHVDRKFMNEMTEVFCKSKIVFNNAIKNDLNMRVFEALCSGSLLVTDPAVGLDELFEDGKHLAIYKDDTLMDTISYYLEHPEERERIAHEGRQEVLEKHTYGHRVDSLMNTLNEFWAKSETGKIDKENMSTSCEEEGYYTHVRHDLIPLIPEDARSILEVGCGGGRTGAYLKERQEAIVAGIEINSEAAEQARDVLDHVVEGNIEIMDAPFPPASFDCILFPDVLEHMVDPYNVLKKIKPLLKPGGSIVASIPNVQFFGLVNHLAEGNWTYQNEGILDRTHLRFFTWKEIQKMFEEAGYEITAIDETLDPQYDQFKNTDTTTLKVGRVTITDLSPEELRRFFVFQYKFSAVPIKEIHNEDLGQNDSVSKNNYKEQAAVFEAEGNLQEADNLYRKWLKEEPESPMAHSGLGNSFIRQGRVQDAIESYKRALEYDSDCIPALLGMGLCSSQKQEHMQAEILFQKVISLEPDNDRALCGLGLVSFQNKHYETAQQFFSKALDIEIENKTAMSWIIQLAYETDHFDEAERALKRFLDKHPANLNMLFGLAGIYFQTGRYESAKELADKILLFDPGNTDALGLVEKLQTATVTQ